MVRSDTGSPSATSGWLCSNLARRGCDWGGASRADTNASQRSGSSWKFCRSARVSGTLDRALSSTKSATLRWAAVAAGSWCRCPVARGRSPGSPAQQPDRDDAVQARAGEGSGGRNVAVSSVSAAVPIRAVLVQKTREVLRKSPLSPPCSF